MYSTTFIYIFRQKSQRKRSYEQKIKNLNILNQIAKFNATLNSFCRAIVDDQCLVAGTLHLTHKSDVIAFVLEKRL